MKTIMKRALAVILAWVMAFGAAPATGLAKLIDCLSITASAVSYSGFCGDYVTWSLDTSTGVLNITGTGRMDDYLISKYVAPWYDYRGFISTIQIDNGITHIGVDAFCDCYNLLSVSIPGSIQYLDHSFRNCTRLANVTLGNGVIEIWSNAFSGCISLTSITIPDSVKSIGEQAFQGCVSLSNINFPLGFEKIYPYAFLGCTSLTNITMPESVYYLGDYAFSNCTGLTDVTISHGIARIESYTFFHCTSLVNVTMPNVFRICEGAFQECTSLTEITIPDKVWGQIEDYAFAGCENLGYAHIPSGVIGIGERAFIDCSSSFYICSDTIDCFACEYARDNGIPFLLCSNNSGFCGNNVTWSLDTSTGILNISGTGDMNNFMSERHTPWYPYRYYIKTIQIDSGVTSIGEYAFCECYNLNHVNIQFGVWKISRDAFSSCTNLTAITIPDSVQVIEDYAFAGCENLSYAHIPPSVMYIGDKAFIDCSSSFYICFLIANYYFYPYRYAKNNGIPFRICGSNSAYMVTYDYEYNGGTYAFTEMDAVECGEEVDLDQSATKEGWEFVGWNTDPDATTGLTSLTMGSEDITLYAIYKKTLTVTFIDYSYEDGYPLKHTRIQTETVYNRGSAVITPPEQYPYDGWEFRGWSSSEKPDASVETNINPCEDTTFYALYERTLTLSYDANGGSSTPDSQTGTQYVNSYSINTYKNPCLTLAGKISKPNCKFTGWTMNSTYGKKYSAGESITIDADATVYAEWSENVLQDSEIYAFSNSNNNFRTGKYTLLDADFNRLVSYVRAYYGSDTDTAKTVINKLQDNRDKSWGGSCYGMSTTILLDKYNKIRFNENFDPGADSMHDVDPPYLNNQVQSAINYYQISYSFSPSRSGQYYPINSSFIGPYALKELVELAKDGSLILFSYWFTGGAGHAIIIKDYELASDGGHNLIAYDNRYPNRDIIVKIDSNYQTCVVNETEQVYAVEYSRVFSALDIIDIDGPNNDMVINLPEASSNNDNLTNLDVAVNGETIITNAEGETLMVSENGTISGTMEILSTHMCVNDNEDGSPAQVTLSFQVRNSSSFSAACDGDLIEFSMQNNKIYASAKTKNADLVTINGDKGIYIVGDNVEYSANLSLNNDIADMVALEGKADHNVNMLYKDGNVEIKGVRAGQSTLTVYSDLLNVDEYDFDSGDNDVLITNNNDGNVCVLASSENDGIYDATLAGNTQAPRVQSVSLRDLRIRFNSSKKLEPNIVADKGVRCTVKYKSSDPDVATVDRDGRVYGDKPGKAEIKITVTDQYGNKVTDTCTVTVRYTLLQWIIIKILAFGWFWY